MGPERWDPFREMVTLRDAMDRLLQQGLARPGGLLAGIAGAGSIPLDVAERDDAFVVKAAIPGAKPDDVEVTVRGDTLAIRVETKPEEDRPGQRWLMRERPVGTAERSINLPVAVEAERAQAQYESGVLTLTLPKAERARPHRVPVGGTRSAAGGPRDEDVGTWQARATTSDAGQGGPDATAGGDRVTEQSQASFPASDPPSWTPERL